MLDYEDRIFLLYVEIYRKQPKSELIEESVIDFLWGHVQGMDDKYRGIFEHFLVTKK